jgi:multicomponent Na+:H+ antiporter subunit D
MAGAAGQEVDLTGVMVNADLTASDYFIVAPVVIPIIFGAILMMLRFRRNWQAPIAVAGFAISLFAEFGLLQKVIAEGPQTMTMGRWLPPFGISFTVDLTGALFAFTGGVVALAGAIYSWRDVTPTGRRYGFYPFFMLMMAGVSGAFLTGDIFNLYVWFEVLLISSFGLIVLGSEKPQLDGTMKYAFLNLVATTMFLVATGYLYGITGTLNMADIRDKVGQLDHAAPLMTIAILYLLAFSMKAAAFPLNFWLPASYHTPKIVVSAIFAGLLTKVGVYALLRVMLMLFAVPRDLLAEPIAWLAALTMIGGALGALAQNDIRRVLGYVVITGIGTMLAGLAVATQTGVTGTLVYAVHSMLVMTALYMAAGVMSRLNGSFDMRQLGGLYAASPMLAAGFLVLAISVSGLPPTSGFWGKFILVKASLEMGAWWLAAAILFAGLLTTLAVFRIWIFAFWRGGPEGTRDGAEAWSIGEVEKDYLLHASLAIGFFVAASLFIGFAPELLISTAGEAAHGLLHPQDYVNSVFGGR